MEHMCSVESNLSATTYCPSASDTTGAGSISLLDSALATESISVSGSRFRRQSTCNRINLYLKSFDDRDLKPENFILADSEVEHDPKATEEVIDFKSTIQASTAVAEENKDESERVQAHAATSFGERMFRIGPGPKADNK